MKLYEKLIKLGELTCHMDALEVTFNFSKEMATGLGTHEIIQGGPHVSRKKKDNLMMLHFVLEKITIWVHESETRDTCM